MVGVILLVFGIVTLFIDLWIEKKQRDKWMG